MDTPGAPQAPKLTWRLVGRTAKDIVMPADGEGVSPSWAWGGATGRGVRVCVLDSGIEPAHPLVGPLDGSWEVVKEENGFAIRKADDGDCFGHGTACAGIIRKVAPACEITSVRVLGEQLKGGGNALLAGLRWAIGQRFDVINLSLSTTRTRYLEELRSLADEAYFHRVVLVASAHNAAVESFPWRFSSVISVGSHPETDPDLYLYNPEPPVEFFAAGQNVEIAWLGGSTIRASGNSFATPFVAGLCARILSKHKRMTPFQVKNALYLSAANTHVEAGGAP